MNNTPTDKRNSLWLSMQFIISISFSLLTLKINIHHFGAENFGIWLLLISIWGLGRSLDLGFGTAILKFVAESKSEPKKTSIIITAGFFVFLVVGFIITFFGFYIGYFIYLSTNGLVKVKSIFYTKVFMILSVSFYFQYLTLFFKAVFEGLSHFTTTSKLSIFQSMSLLIGSIIVLVLKFTLIELALVYFVSYLIILSVYSFVLVRKFPQFKVNLQIFNFGEVKKILKFSIPIQGMTIFNSLIDPVVKYLVGSYLNLSYIPAYEIARKSTLAISGLFFNTFKIILPKTSSLITKNEKIEFIENDLVKYSNLGIAFSGIFFGIMLLPAIFALDVFFSIPESILIFLILALPESINNFGYAIYNFFLGLGEGVFLAKIQFINLVTTVLMLVISFSLFNSSIGLLGYFFSVLLGNILMILKIKREWNAIFFTFLKKLEIIKLISLIFLLLITILGVNLELTNGYYVFLFFSLISTIVFYSNLKHYGISFIRPIFQRFR
jgi:O-antigen/teichoic acid export membrane protein